MHLKGITAVVTGATGEVGRGAAYALNDAGAFVYLAGRSFDKLKAVQATLPRKDASDVIASDYSTVQGAEDLKAKVADKTFDVVVASSGPYWAIRKMTETDPATLLKAAQANFLSQLYLYNVLAPKCKGRYLCVNGSAALNILAEGLTGVVANGVVGAARLMFDECSNNPENLPTFTHIMLKSSVGHSQFRDVTNDPLEYGKVFVAMALGKHETDGVGTIEVDDDVYRKLVAML